MAAEGNVRVSDADREFAAAQLREHYAQGRLTLDELNERLDRAFASRTRTDLNAVTSDLPYAAPNRGLPSDGARWSSFGPAGQVGPGPSSPRWTGPWQGGRGGHGYGRGRSSAGFLAIIPVMLALWVCFAVLSVFAFGIGSGPSVLAIFLAAVAAIRWIFGRGRRRHMRRYARPAYPRGRGRGRRC
jgi:hypothetical protein